MSARRFCRHRQAARKKAAGFCGSMPGRMIQSRSAAGPDQAGPPFQHSNKDQPIGDFTVFGEPAAERLQRLAQRAPIG
jgi:hypothetical protein